MKLSFKITIKFLFKSKFIKQNHDTFRYINNKTYICINQMTMKITDNFFKIDNNLKPAKGRVLISEPLLNDYFFKRSVILLTEHNDEGSIRKLKYVASRSQCF